MQRLYRCKSSVEACLRRNYKATCPARILNLSLKFWPVLVCVLRRINLLLIAQMQKILTEFLKNFHAFSRKKCVRRHIKVKTSFIFVTKAEFEMYRFDVDFPVCNPKLFACVNGRELVKTALLFNSFSNSKLMCYFTSSVMRVSLSVLFFTSRNGHRNSPRNIQQL